MVNSWVQTIQDHGFTVIPLDNGGIRVVGSSWIPETGQQIDEILQQEKDGTFFSIEVLSDTGEKLGEYEYLNLHHFLGY